jgi:hypothetical protein
VVQSRVGIYHILTDYNNGRGPDLIVLQMPSVPLALIHKVIAFYLENQAKVDAYLAGYRSEMDQLEQVGRQNHPAPSLAELRQRLSQMKSAS